MREEDREVIKTKPATDQYRDGWDRIFGNPDENIPAEMFRQAKAIKDLKQEMITTGVDPELLEAQHD